jgi:anti-anti-sigma factor
MELKNATLGYTPTLVVAGDIDERTCGTLQAALDKIFASGHNIIFLDLSDVTHVDTAGLAVFVAGVEALHGRGWLGMIAPSNELRDLLASGGLIPHPNVLIFDNRQDALAIVGQRQST